MLLHNFINKNEKEILEELRTKPYFFSLLPPNFSYARTGSYHRVFFILIF